MGKSRHYKNQVVTTEQSIDNEAKNILEKVASQSLQTSEDVNFDDLIKMFNTNQLKKTMQRILKSNQLYDKVTEEALTRFTNNPDEFTQQDLLNYMKVLQDSITNSQKMLATQQEQVNKPLIQINQQNINTTDTISKESQEKILGVVEQLMKIMNSENVIVDGEVSEIVEGESNE